MEEKRDEERSWELRPKGIRSSWLRHHTSLLLLFLPTEKRDQVYVLNYPRNSTPPPQPVRPLFMIKGIQSTWFPRSRPFHANHTCLSNHGWPLSRYVSNCPSTLYIQFIIKLNTSCSASSNELSIVFSSYAITVVRGDGNDTPEFGMELAGCALCHAFTCAKARLSTRVYLANCSYHIPAAGNGGERHPMACTYQSGGYSVAVTLAAL
jgi:hypothetical protein